MERGTAVTTRDLAAAAGVAEGTLFRVFEDKATLLREAVLAAIDPSQMLAPLNQIDPDLPLEERVVEILRISQARVERTVAWMSMLHQLGSPEQVPGHHGPPPEWQERRRVVRAAIRDETMRLLAPDAGSLRIDLQSAADLLETLLTGAAVRAVEDSRSGVPGSSPSPQALAAMYLSGVVAHDPPTAPCTTVPEEPTPC